MKEKVLILGKRDLCHSFLNECREFNIATEQIEPSEIRESFIEDFDIIVRFPEDDLKSLSILKGSTIKESQIWLSEIFASSLSKESSQNSFANQMVGFTLAYPFPEKKFVELVSTENTRMDVMDKARYFFKALNFTVVNSKDHPGFIFNRIIMSMINEAVYEYMYGLASMEDIDQMMRLGANFPMGPFEYADVLGLDRILSMLEWLTEELGPQYRPCPLLRRKVEAGLLGKKTGKGFYAY